MTGIVLIVAAVFVVAIVFRPDRRTREERTAHRRMMRELDRHNDTPPGL